MGDGHALKITVKGAEKKGNAEEAAQPSKSQEEIDSEIAQQMQEEL